MRGHTEPDVPLTSRRAVLAAAGTLLGAGCLGLGGDSVHVLSAGSLATTFEDHVGPAFESETGTELRGEYFGTNALIRMVEDRTTVPDVVVSADATLLRDRLAPDWDVTFASNSLGIGYSPDTAFGEALTSGDGPWYDLVTDLDSGEFAIADPDLDPLGYRAVQAFKLAEREHGLDGFRDEVLETAYREPEEPQLMAGVETGSTAAAVVYRNMAIDHDLPFYEFPPAYNFADPSLSDHYATATYTTDEGYTATGRPIVYSATVYEDAASPAAGRDLVQFLADSGQLLVDAGLTVGDTLPTAHGTTPEGITV
ncbi:extracellular solute-binding protein [Halovenus sp. WSH3]|uniref:Extracellular solute-binding protein n=1 Tax=Halovenus carboxidivorans TaxID=2692199 RepID=A0A6B0T3L7_9EURY|nr:extracellular solute-binding protein [Halovenus carboxidivorans]MXR52654.1 extracellular solute-binding protein [Halovenus carboxidivorans]